MPTKKKKKRLVRRKPNVTCPRCSSGAPRPRSRSASFPETAKAFFRRIGGRRQRVHEQAKTRGRRDAAKRGAGRGGGGGNKSHVLMSYLFCYVLFRSVLFCLVFYLNLNYTFWTSRGHKHHPFPATARALIFIAQRVQHSHCVNFHTIILHEFKHFPSVWW